MPAEQSARQPPLFPDGVAVVIGASGGIGSAIAAGLAEAGTDLVLTYRTRASAAQAAAEHARGIGRRAATLQLSLERGEEVTAAFERIAAEYGRIHTVVVAAGSSIPMRYIGQIDPADFHRVIDADVGGFFHTARAALPHLRGRGGSLVYVSSAGLRRWPVRDALSVVPKAAVEALVRGIAREEGRYGIRANAVALGVVEAGMFLRLKEQGELDERWIEAAIANTPLRRFCRPEEVADAVVFLASSRAAYITGQTLYLDGGYGL